MPGSDPDPGAAPEIRRRHIRVQRSARYALLGEPSPDIRDAWFVCHGYRQLAAPFLRHFRGLAGPDRLIVAPEALNRFYLDDEPGPHGPESRVGATWMTRADREAEIRDYVGYLDALYAHLLTRTAGGGAATNTAPRVHVLGFSQGAATVSRWAAYGRARIDRLLLWSGLPAHDLDLERAAGRLRDVDLVFVLGTEDRFTTRERLEAERARLQEYGIASAFVTFEGGHRIDEETLERIERRLERIEARLED